MSDLKSPKKDMKSDSTEKRRRRKHEESSSSESDGEKSVASESESESELDMDKYRKVISKLFPSKYMKKRMSEIKDSKKKAKKAIKKDIKHKDKKKRIVESESESESESNEDDDDELDIRSKKKNFNIIFTIADPLAEEDSEYDEGEDSDYDEEEDSEYDESEEEEEDEFSEEDDDSEYEGDDEDMISSNRKTRSQNKKKFLSEKDVVDTFKSLKQGLEKMLETDPDNHILKDSLKDLEDREKNEKKRLRKTQQKDRTKNTNNFKKLIKNKNSMNDFNYFKNKLSIEQQQYLIKEVEEVNKISNTEKPYRLALLESEIPCQLKSVAMKKIASLRYMEPGQGEYYKVKNWVDTFMQIPFNKNKHLPITYDMGMEKCNDFMENAKTILDDAVYGMNDAKMQIMQMVGQWITNPSAMGTAIAIKGPMGTGKTTLIKDGISKILGRDFAFIALGGATDSSFLEGHSYTYEGSTWGKIVDILIKSKSMNPVIYFDELDKISDTPKGEEIAGILTHLTDTSQNNQFHDKYFSEIDFDLSKCLFIFSYNDESKVNPILLDRMYKIQTKGFEKKDKREICHKYLLPKIMSQINFDKKDVIIPDDTISYIIDNFTSGESGVRNLKRCLEIVCTKLNLYRLMKPGSNLFEEEKALDVQFPYTVDTDVIRKLIKVNDERSELLKSIYI
jgi:ATP-dependent Lon protease